MDVLKKEKTKHDVPVEQLDYAFVEKCNDIKQLEKILKVLRSGSEGLYPQLEEATEEKIRKINPKSRILLKDQPIWSTKELGKEGSALSEEFAQWTDEIQNVENAMKSGSVNGDRLPPVRGSHNIQIGSQGKADKGASQTDESKSKRKPMPRSQKEWDKFDVDAELRKMEQEEQDAESKPTQPSAQTKNTLRIPSKPNLPDHVDATGLTDDEKRVKAEKEKLKGNEAFSAGDYAEAVLYYTRSISLDPTVACINNRAQAHVKLERWDEAIRDCDSVLHQDPDNLKAHLRRSVALKGKRQYRDARASLEFILSREPNNKRAKDLLAEVDKALEEQKVKGRRMVIEEVSGDEESDDDTDVISSKPKVKVVKEEDDCADMSNVAVKEETKPAQSKIVEVQENELKKSATEESNTSTADSTPAAQAAKADDAKVKEAMEEKEETKPKENEESESTPAPTPPPPLSAELNKIKEEGNTFFRNGNYAEAITKYNTIITKLENDEAQGQNLAVLYSNRAACRIKIGECGGCVEDCNRSLVLAPHNVKALLRRAMAQEHLERYRQAYVDYRHVLNIDSSVDIARQGSSRCQSALQAQDGPKWREKLPPIPSISRSSLPPQPPKGVPASVAEKVVPKAEVPNVSNEKLFEKHKAEGNENVKKGNYQQAIECYTECVRLDIPGAAKTAAYTNRALCYLKLNQPREVLGDCDCALQQEPGNVKALFRRAQAYKILKQYEASERDLELILTLDKVNTAARRELKVVQNCFKEEKVKKMKEEELAAKGRRKIQIQETDSSGDEEDQEAPPTQPPTASKSPVNSASQSNTSVQNSNAVPTKNSDANHQKINMTSQSENQIKSKPAEKRKESKEGQSSGESGSGDRKGTQGMGVDYDMKAAKASSKIRPTAQSVKTDIKATPYEFLSAWNALKQSAATEAYLHVLRQVRPEQLPTVISNKLDGGMLEKIIHCAAQLAHAGEKTLAYDYLRHLTKVPRFQVNCMFMDKAEKQEIADIVAKLKDEVNDKELAALKSQYSL